jgi:hypothetical protein
MARLDDEGPALISDRCRSPTTDVLPGQGVGGGLNCPSASTPCRAASGKQQGVEAVMQASEDLLARPPLMVG